MKIFTTILACAGLVTVVLAGCGGGGGSGAPPVPTPTPRPTATPTPLPTPTPVGTPLPTPTPGNPPSIVFDLRGRTFVDNVATSGVTVTATGSAGATTASETTVSGAGGVYSFFLGAGTYTVKATSGARSVTRTITIPPGGQTVDNFDLRL